MNSYKILFSGKYTLAILLLFSLLSACQKSDVVPDDRRKFTGRYDADEFSYELQTNSLYRIEIRNSEIVDEIFIDNFHNAGMTVSAIVTGSKIIIPTQENDYYIIEKGIGTLNGTVLDLTYDVTSKVNNFTDIINTKCTKR